MKKIILLLMLAFFGLSANAQTWSKVVCGGVFSAALRSDSTLWSWGFNGDGELGTGNTIGKLSPVQIGTDHDWTDISVGGYNCLAIKSDGTLWGWGYNHSGQVGDGTTVNKYSPTQIGIANNWAKISNGPGIHSQERDRKSTRLN